MHSNPDDFMMIRKVLIANRGEIACRIIRTCREMGIATVAVYSDADARALHVEMADEAVHIGASPAQDSYLNIEKIVAAGKRTDADAVHPGYGFLSENAAFAKAVLDAGMIFIGPSPNVIEAMGSKQRAKRMLKDIPLVPGYSGDEQSDERLSVEAEKIGYPVMVKAAAGGGGRGMRQVNTAGDLAAALQAARREAGQAFGDDTLILEQVVKNPRHIEVQIFGDQFGNVIAVGERECTIQRRHQKIIEETPSTALTSQLRTKMFKVAASIGTQLGYVSAGTIEFLLDDKLNFYFMEMNTRLQVEHPITEETTGVDLVRWQFMVAEGFPLPDMDIYPAGHAIEVRIYAEDPAHEFLPTTGKILRWREPSEVRVDAGVRSGDTVGVYYDPMLAKIIAYGEHREGAIRRLDYALSQLQLLGLRNNIAYLRRVLCHADHVAGSITTAFIEQHPDLLKDDEDSLTVALIGAALGILSPQPPLHSIERGGNIHEAGDQHWRNNAFRPIKHRFRYGNSESEILLSPAGEGRYSVEIADGTCDVQVWSYRDGEMSLSVDGHRQTITIIEGKDNRWWVHTLRGSYDFKWIDPLPESGQAVQAEGSLHAPMPGQIRAVYVEIGQHVQAGDVLMIVEAMKMEHRIKAPYSGTIKVLHFAVGESVQADSMLLELQADR